MTSGPGPRRSRRAARPGPPCRRFGLGDAMILVAGAAVGTLGVQDRLLGHLPGEWAREADLLAELVLMLASCLVLAFRLRSPRPSLRRVARQPGAVACFAAVGIMIASDANWLASLTLAGGWGDVGPIGEWAWLLLDLPHRACAAAVPICWALLAFGGRWRPEPGWIDGCGRALGWGWIAWLASGPLLPSGVVTIRTILPNSP